MINLTLDNTVRRADLDRSSGNIGTSDLLNTAVLIALFTRRKALPDDVLPDELSKDREGWWADAYDEHNSQIGSRLWLLNRSKATRTVVNLAKTYAEEALQWLVDDGVAKSVVVEVEAQNDVLAFRVQITKPDRYSSKWDAVWTAHLAEL